MARPMHNTIAEPEQRNDGPPPIALPTFPTTLMLLFIWIRYLILLTTITFIYLLTTPLLVTFNWLQPLVVEPSPGVQQSVVQAFAHEPNAAHIQGLGDAQGQPITWIQRARGAFALCSLFLTSLIVMSIIHGYAPIFANLHLYTYLAINQPVKVVSGQVVVVPTEALLCAVMPFMSVVAAEPTCKANLI